MSFSRNTIHASAHFSSDYDSARDKFCEAARQQKWKLLHYPMETFFTRSGKALACDVAIRDRADSDCAVIVSSGLHGVEGFFGSAVQHAWFKRCEAVAGQNGPRMIFLHALNPYGFARLRRCDAENVDVNRNFVFDSEYGGHNPLYERLDGLLNPPRPPARAEPFWLKTLVPICRFGYPALRQALAEGQYDFPKGLFFGGQKSSWTKQLLEQNLKSWIGACSRIVHIDFHTGLGKWGTHQLLLDYTPSDSQRNWLQQRLGSHRPLELSSRVAYVTRGSVGAWCQHHFRTKQYIYACAEFGTFGQKRILVALRRENQAHHWAADDDPRTQRVKRQLQDAFCPPSDDWREAVLQGGLDIIDDAIQGIAALPKMNGIE